MSLRRKRTGTSAGRRFGTSAVTAMLAVLCSVAGLPAVAQQETGATTGDAAEESSRRVDESEESFRARMELREQRLREQRHSNTTFSYSTSREGKLANLPQESQRHIREQLRDMIVESRLWKPGEDLTNYPYEPSNAAKSDALLARQEREAWVEQLQKYQEREAAAAAAGRGNSAAAGTPSGDGRQGTSAQQNARGPSASGTASDTAASGPVSAGAEDRSAQPVGVSESALEFLRQRGLAGGAADAQAGEPASPADGADGGPEKAMAQGPEQQAAIAPEGTVDVAELRRIDFAIARADAASDPRPDDAEADVTMRDVTLREPEPGTVDVGVLRELDPRLLGADVPRGPEP